ncbi:MAG: glycosyltransferase, partial [Pseudolabrys sp.]|nr:glycosyltransferase [Pseudolabrys sp.]
QTVAQPRRGRPRSLSGATILQLVPSLTDDSVGQAAVEIALTLLKAGARAIIAGGDGPLVGELRTFGGEWLSMTTDTVNPLRVGSNTRHLQRLIAGERIDIIHAHCASAARSALAATARQPVYLVTSFPDRLQSNSSLHTYLQRPLALGDRVIAPSSYISRAMIERYGIPPDRITVIPRAVDTATFSPTFTNADRIAAMRRAWGLLPHMRIVLVSGRVAPWNGQMSMIDAARLMVSDGKRNIAFVFVGEDRSHPAYRHTLIKRARDLGVDTLIRIVGHCPDMPTALAAADVVVVPSLQPPLTGRAAAEGQALGRPVVTTAVGALPENVLAPPRMREDLRTGWIVRPGNATELARATTAALNLDATTYEALGARARQFAEFMFSPPSVAEAIRGVYTSLLARDA